MWMSYAATCCPLRGASDSPPCERNDATAPRGHWSDRRQPAHVGPRNAALDQCVAPMNTRIDGGVAPACWPRGDGDGVGERTRATVHRSTLPPHHGHDHGGTDAEHRDR